MSGPAIVWNFDHHVCVSCRGRRSHRIGHVLVDPEQAKGDFMLKCTACCAQDGPFAGPRQLDAKGDHLPTEPPT